MEVTPNVRLILPGIHQEKLFHLFAWTACFHHIVKEDCVSALLNSTRCMISKGISYNNNIS